MVSDRRTRAVSRAILAEAAAWIARRHSDSRTSEDDRGLNDWIAARPEHAEAYRQVTRAWDAVIAVPRESSGAPARELGPRRRRAWLAATAGIAALVAGVATWQASFAGMYQTGIGEQRHVALSDGTQVFLDADSRIRVRFERRRRVVELQKGRANFRVAFDSSRPFIVNAAGRIVAADQSTFDVRREGDDVTVLLTRGQASVASVDTVVPQALSAGQRLVATAAVEKVDEPSIPRLVAWQSGQAIFDNDTLEQAVREMNRYSTVELSVADPVAASLRLSGVYRVGDNDTFAKSIAVLLPVKIVKAERGIKFLVDSSRLKP